MADQRLEGIGQNRFAAVATALEFTGAETQVITKLEAACQNGKRLALDQPGPQPRQLAFTGLRKMVEQRLASNEVEDGVAEKLRRSLLRPA